MDMLFWEHVHVGGVCWEWTRATDGKSRGREYGRVKRGGKVWLTHRYAWEQLVGPIPDGMTIEHICRNKRCVNPDHLELLTLAENGRRNNNTRKTHCSKGHEYTPENTHVYEGKYRSRICKTCRSNRVRR